MNKHDYTVWQKANEKNAANLIITGAKGLTPEEGFKSADAFIEWMFKNHKSVLDFGAGAGRNTFVLAKKYKYVDAYDFPNMLQLIIENKKFPNSNIGIYTDWNFIKNKKYGAIFCSLVLQHLHPEDLEKYLNDFANMTPYLYTITRSYTDFTHSNIYQILSKNWDITRIFDQIEPFGRSLCATQETIENASGEDHYACLWKVKK